MDITKLIYDTENVDNSFVIRMDFGGKFSRRKINKYYKVKCKKYDYIVIRKYYDCDIISIGATNDKGKNIDLTDMFDKNDYAVINNLIRENNRMLDKFRVLRFANRKGIKVY